MKKKKERINTDSNPNFILYDIGIQSAFAQMCQSFQKQGPSHICAQQDWLIIDNDTGEIITDTNKSQT